MLEICARVYCYPLFVAIILLASSLASVAGEAPADRQASQAGIRRELDALLARLAASAERTTMGGRMGSAGESMPDVIHLCRASRFLAVLPAAERYRLLKEWILPSGPGAMMRTAMCYVPVEFPPEFFFSDVRLPESPGGAGPDGDGVICFVEMLVEAAAEAGKLPELASAAEEAAKKSNMAGALLALVSFASGRGENVVRRADEVLDAWRSEIKSTAQGRVNAWSAYTVARAWMRSDSLRDQGERLAELLADFARSADQRPLLSHLACDRAQCRLRRCGGVLASGADPTLTLWHPGGYYFSRGSQVGTWPGWWIERNGMLVHWSGPEISPLYFDYPLAGTFEFSVDGYFGPSAEAAIQYGRIVFEPFSSSEKTRLWAIGEQASVERPAVAAVPGRFNKLTIRVGPERVSYLCNGALVLEDKAPSPTTPWLALFSRAARTTAWCNLRMTGDPRIPREVALIHGDRMDGWMSPLYRERLPQPFSREDSGENLVATPRSPTPDCAWSTADGVLHGRSTGSSSRPGFFSQSWLTYHRPVRSGESVSYEFFYKPGEKIVYPTLGRMAVMTEPGGVRLHWMTDVPHVALGGLRPDNAAELAEEQRGPRPLPLKPNAWNAMSMRMAGDRATFRLNGVEVYERRLAPADSRMFGLFHYRSHTAVEVRSIVLKGNWPESLSSGQRNDLAARPADKEGTENERGRKALVDDSWFILRDQAKEHGKP